MVSSKETNKITNLNKIKERGVDLDAVNDIVTQMKNRSSKSGSGSPISEGHLKELREIISEGKLANLDIDTESKLISNSDSILEKNAIVIYKPFKKIINKIIMVIVRNPIGKSISYNLTSANIKKTLVQHLIFSILYALIVSVFLGIVLFTLLAIVNPWLLFIFPVVFLIFFILFIIIFSYIVPMQKARMRGILIDLELPFGLRHLATELQAGIGLFKVLQSIAKNDYGVLSEEMNRTIMEIENGTDTKTALRHAALRSQSKNFNVAIFHIIRTLNTGGNLANTINGVADTVSFDLMESAKEFGEKMNFFGIIFIFVAIVLPVFVAILGAIANAPLGQGGSLFLPGVMTPTLLSIIFLVILPITFVLLIYAIKVMEPKM